MSSLVAVTPWAQANHRFLLKEVERVRLSIQRRIAWLRLRWRHDPLQAYQGLVISDAQADSLLTPAERHAETDFYRDDPVAAELGRALAEVERECARQAEELTAAGTPPALEVLAHRFGLSAFERAVLVLCLAPEIDPALERLYAYVQDDVVRRMPTPQLALALFAGNDWVAARSSFLAAAPLRRFRLLTLELNASPPLPLGSAPLRLDERIADYLITLGLSERDPRSRLDGRLGGLLVPVPAAPVTEAHGALVDQLAGAFDPATRRLPILNLVGPPGSGKQAVARALCERLGLRLLRLRAGRLPAAGPDRGEVVAILEREAVLLQLAYYVDATESWGESTAPAPAEALEQLPTLLVIGSAEPWPMDQPRLTVRVPKPERSAQAGLWRRALGPAAVALDGHLDALVQQFELGPSTIARVVASARQATRYEHPDAAESVRASDLWQACREELVPEMQTLARRIVPCHTWEDIVLPPDALSHLREIAAQVASRARVYESWGFGTKLGRGRGINALFAGPSGTGKTMAAEILANHLRLDLFRIDLSGVVSKYIGETEKNLARVFDAAEQSGAILFFDEADALFGKRSEVKDSHDRYANIEINYLLQRMEDYRGLAILATNMKASLDQAFLRRLRFLVEFPFPDAGARRAIWRGMFPAQADVQNVDYDGLARLEVSGGSIKNIVLNAAFLAAAAAEPIQMRHVLHAVKRECAKLGKLPQQSELGPYYAGLIA